jgi:hypothetical protein
VSHFGGRCGIVSDQANAGALSSREELEKMARRRFQRGSVLLRGKRKPKWVGRWREDVINKQGKLVRINRKEVLGTKSDFPTKKLALRELERRIAPINSANYRALRTATFAEFAEIWKNNALTRENRPGCATLRKRSPQTVWGYGACRIVAYGGIGPSRSRCHSVCERRLPDHCPSGPALQESFATGFELRGPVGASCANAGPGLQRKGEFRLNSFSR